MPNRIKDLLICYIGLEYLATQVASRFHSAYPRISICTGSMTGALSLAAKIRFRAVVVVTDSNLNVVTGVMTSRILKLGYSSRNAFVLNLSPTRIFKHQYLVKEYGRDNVDVLIERAKLAAGRDSDGHWLTQGEIEIEEGTTAPTLKSRLFGNKWVAKLIRIISRR